MDQGRICGTAEEVELGVSTLYLLGMDFDSAFRSMQRKNVPHWEIFDDGLHALNYTRVRRLAQLADSKGVSFSVHGPICDLNLATLNPELAGMIGVRLQRSLKNAALLGAKTWVLHPGTHGALSWVRPGQDWTVNRDSIQRIHRLGKTLGVGVVIENISAGLAILGRVADFQRLYRGWNRPPGLALDVGHSHIKGETDLFLSQLGERIVHVHAHDNMGDFDKHLAVGSGSIRWKSVLAGLMEIGFRGHLVVESVKAPFGSFARIGKLLLSLQ